MIPAEPGQERVYEYTGGGPFVLDIGEEVNKTTRGNLCTQVEIEKAGAKCSAGAEGGGSGEVESEPGTGDLLAVRSLLVQQAI